MKVSSASQNWLKLQRFKTTHHPNSWRPQGLLWNRKRAKRQPNVKLRKNWTNPPKQLKSTTWTSTFISNGQALEPWHSFSRLPLNRCSISGDLQRKQQLHKAPSKQFNNNWWHLQKLNSLDCSRLLPKRSTKPTLSSYWSSLSFLIDITRTIGTWRTPLWTSRWCANLCINTASTRRSASSSSQFTRSFSPGLHSTQQPRNLL